MIHKKMLITGTLATLLVTTLVAQENCVGGVCFVNLKNLKPTKVFHEKKEKLVVLQKPRFIEHQSEVFEHYPKEIDESIDIVVDGELITVFPPSVYVMTKQERIAYYKEQKAIALNKKMNDKENEELEKITKPIEKIEDKILNKSSLPTSQYYCDDNRKPVYDKDSDLFECV